MPRIAYEWMEIHLDGALLQSLEAVTLIVCKCPESFIGIGDRKENERKRERRKAIGPGDSEGFSTPSPRSNTNVSSRSDTYA